MRESFIFGVVGHHIGYSRSPQIFSAISELKGFDHSFVLHDIDPLSFDEEFPNVIQSGINGFSVTIPHKHRVIPFIDEVDSTAVQIGAVNSVCVKGDKVYGYTTDGDGFRIPLERHRPELTDGVALILGAGGAARAVVHCLSTVFGATKFYMIGRDIVKLNQFCAELGSVLPSTDLRPLASTELSGLKGIDYSIVVNCTPLAGWNHPTESPLPANFDWLPNKIYYDLSYNDRNRIVRLATEKGLFAYDGSAMLIGQALRSLQLWTGHSIEFDPVYDAVFGHR